MKKWYMLLVAGIILLSLTFSAWFFFPKITRPTGEYMEIYDGNTLVTDWATYPHKNNPYWVRQFQSAMPAGFIFGSLLLGLGLNGVFTRGRGC